MISFSLAKTKICLHFSFFAVLCLFFQLGQGGWGPWCFLAALIHELGHLLAFSVQGVPPRELHFQLNGIRLVPPDTPLPLLGELFTLLGGAILSLCCGGALWAMGHPVAAGFHLMTGLFSLLPVRGLDGGEILFLLAENLFPQKGRVAAAFLSTVFALFFTACALVLGAKTQSPSLFLLAAGLLFSVFPNSSPAYKP